MPRAKNSDPLQALRKLIGREIFKLDKESRQNKDKSTVTPAALASLKQLQDLQASIESKAEKGSPIDTKKLSTAERHILLWANDVDKWTRGQGERPPVPAEVLADAWQTLGPPSAQLAIWRALASALAAAAGCSEQDAYARLQSILGYPPGAT